MANALTVLAALFLLFIMSIVVIDVILRAIDPAYRMVGVLDYVEFGLNWLIFLAIPLALFRDRLIVVDFVDPFDRRGRLLVAGRLLTTLALLLLLSQVIRPALDVLEWQERTLDLGILKFHYWLAIWIGVGLSVVAMILRTAVLRLR